MLITDGVLEARNNKGEIYGFDRLAALMREKTHPPEQIADTACRFGQDDDITVLSMTREATRAKQSTASLHTLLADA